MTAADLHRADELELTDYLRILRNRWPWVVLATTIVVGAALVLSLTSEPKFASTAQVSLGDSAAQEAVQGAGLSNRAAASRELSNEVNLALSDAVRTEVLDQLGTEPDVTITPEDESDALRFTAEADTADEAALYANTWAQIYVDTKRRQASESIRSAIEVFENDLADLRTQRQELREPIDDLEIRLAGTSDEVERATIQGQLSRAEADLRTELDLIDARISAVAQSITNLEVSSRLASTGTASVVQVAAPPQEATNASLSRNLVLALIVGLIIGAAGALLAENLDRSIKTTEDLSSFGIPVLGEIPQPGRDLSTEQLPFATMHHGGTPVAESYQKVRTSVEFVLLGKKINSLLITSPNQSDGKSTLATNLAWAMSAVDHRVALVDVDFRRPRLHEVFGCPQAPGLSDNLLSGRSLVELALRVDHDGSRNFIMLPAGSAPPSPANFVASPPFSTLIRGLESEADLVVLDAPPVLPVSDAISIARQVDAVLVVVRAGKTTRDQLEDTLESLQQVGADVIGICIVGTKQTASNYGYYRQEESPRNRRRRRAADDDVLDVRDPQQVGANGNGYPTGDLTSPRY